MSPLLISSRRRRQLLSLTLGMGLAVAPAVIAHAQEPAALGAGSKANSVRTDKDPLRARSATENVVFGQIVSTDEHRLTLREGEGDAVTETVYRLSPSVRVYSRDRVVDLSDLPPSTRVRFSRSTEPDAVISELYAVDDTENSDAAARAAEQTTDSKSDVGLGLVLQDADGAVKVVGVRPDGPADKAGIKAGDRIVRIDNSVISTSQEIFDATESMKANQRATLTIRRDDREQTMSLVAAAGPGARDAIRTATTAAPTRVLGDEGAPVAKNDVTPEVNLGAALETTPDGVAVVRLDAVSPLADAGLKSGDFIKTAAGQSVVTPDALFRVLNEFDGGSTVELTAMRNGESMEFKVTLPEDHKKVLVDRAEELEAPVRNDLTVRTTRHTDPRLLQQIRRTQEVQQAQLKYLHDAMLQLARAAGVDQGVFGNSPYPFAGGVLPVGVGGVGEGTGGNCFSPIGFDANGNPVIAVNEAGTALGVVGFNENGYPILAETTLVTPANNGNGNNSTGSNGDGFPPQPPREPEPNEIDPPNGLNGPTPNGEPPGIKFPAQRGPRNPAPRNPAPRNPAPRTP